MNQLNPTTRTNPIPAIMEELTRSLNIKYRTDVQQFKRKYAAVEPKDIRWCAFCQDALEFGCLKFAFLFFTRLLELRIYHGEYQRELYGILPMFQLCAATRINANVRYLLCGEQITDLVIFKNDNSHNGRFGYAYVKNKNPYIRTELLDFMEDARMHNRWHNRSIIEVFEISLGDHASEIKDHTGFTDITFWEQINYYKRLFPAPAEEYRNSIKAVCYFYRWCSPAI